MKYGFSKLKKNMYKNILCLIQISYSIGAANTLYGVVTIFSRFKSYKGYLQNVCYSVRYSKVKIFHYIPWQNFKINHSHGLQIMYNLYIPYCSGIYPCG